MDAFIRTAVIYSLQIFFIVSMAAIGARAIRIPSPRGRLSYWRGVLLICLLIPMLPPRAVGTIAQTTVQTVTSPTTTAPAMGATVAPMTTVLAGFC